MIKLNIKRSDIVLEVGSGDFPNIYSDILVDKYPMSNKYRNFNLKTDRRPFIVADGEALPFSDKSFNYCISANALTYSEKPEKFLNEITRVTPRGLLILPTELNERIYDTPYHRWFINYIDGKIILRPKKIEKSFGRFFHLLYRKNYSFRHLQDTNISLFYTIIEWQDKIPFEIQRDNFDSLANLSDEEQILLRYPVSLTAPSLSRRVKNMLPNNLKYFLLKSLIRLSRWPRPKLDLEKLIVCSICHKSMNKRQDNFICLNCHSKFPIKNNIPYFLLDDGLKAHF